MGKRQKDIPVRTAGRPFVFQVINQGFDQGTRKRQRENILVLNGWKGHHCLDPVEVFKPERSDFTGAHTQAGRHQDYREVASSSAMTSVDAAE